ncbi:hypothetical protein QQF64_011304 [Cirrhinus molitorella]|uniref:Ig-like domain-containing protein n=1 Tax=Cirrhinus molitorella TaxID=172907 RepID=A0ABR3LZS5_9TELE
MNPALVFLILSLQWITGCADANDVTQSPNIMLRVMENATLTCSHTKGATYDRMYWFRQHQGKTMELIVYTTSFNTKEFEKLKENKYSVNHETAAKGVLTVKNLESDDSALYLCAMNLALVFLIISLHWITGFADANDVTQSTNIMLPVKKNATLTCSHTKGATYDRMYWFRQHQGKTMELIVYTTSYDIKEFGKLKENKYSVNHKTAAKGDLTVKNLESDDSALYLCAVNMIRILSFFFLICLSDISNTQDIYQNPKDLIKDPGQSIELHCSHSSSYNVMLWYKQKSGESLELLGYLVASGDTVEEEFKKKITLDGNANKNSVLKLERLSSDDSAVYFCAASLHSAVGSLPSQQKP